MISPLILPAQASSKVGSGSLGGLSALVRGLRVVAAVAGFLGEDVLGLVGEGREEEAGVREDGPGVREDEGLDGDARFEGEAFVGGEVAFLFGVVGPFLGDRVEIASGMEEVEEVDGESLLGENSPSLTGDIPGSEGEEGGVCTGVVYELAGSMWR